MSASWNAAVAHHQAGRLSEAEAAYRQVLAASPRHFDAMHLLGVVHLQRGVLDEAERLIQQALSLNPKSAPAHNNLGTVHLRAGRLEAARACFERAVKQQAGYGDALLNLGSVLHRLGRATDAVSALRRAVSALARSAPAHNALGAALLDAGDADGAARAFQAAVKLAPGRADLLNNLANAQLHRSDAAAALAAADAALAIDDAHAPAWGSRGRALAMAGRVQEARPSLERALKLEPSAAAHANLGAFLHDQGDLDGAVPALREAARLAPGLVAARITLAQALLDGGQGAQALETARGVASDHPSNPAAQSCLAAALAQAGELEPAVTAYRQAVALPGAGASVHLGLANTLMRIGRAAEAMQHYEKAVRLDPQDPVARWGQAMAHLKPVYATAADMATSRQGFDAALKALDAWFDERRAPMGHRAVGSTQPFYLAYHPQSNRELLGRHGALCARLMSAWPDKPAPVTRAAISGRPLRLGIVSAHVRDHSVWNAITRGWVRHLDPRRFELHVCQLHRGADAETARARGMVARFVDGPTTLRGWIDAVRASAPDVLLYPEVGMDAMTLRLAALRLAPVQAATWGHPETTGLPTIDLYLSAAAMEPQGAQAHYAERLVALPNLGVCYEPAAAESVAPDLAALGLPVDEPLLLCAGTPYKYTPDRDDFWVRIARELPRGRLVFFAMQGDAMIRQLHDRLRAAFERAGVDHASRVCLVPRLDRARFHGLMKRAALMLDTPGFSGFNTAMQALEAGLPVLAHEGPFLRGRLASGPLRTIGMDDLVATSDDAFVAMAARLAGDAAALQSMRTRIADRRPALFGDLAPVRALEQALIDAVAAA